jgi:hypothetical protein
MKGLMLACAWSIAAAAPGRAPDVTGIRAYELPDYTLVTADPAAARAAIRAAKQAEAILGRLLGPTTAARSAPTFLMLVRNPTWSRYLMPRGDVTGVFAPGPFASYLGVGIRDDIERAVRHEYSHSFLHTRFGGFVPQWFDEGVARLVEAPILKGDIATIGVAGMWHWYADDWMPMETLLGLSGHSRIYRDSYSTYTVHKQALVMVHRGLVADPGQFGKQMYALIAAQDDQVPPRVAIHDIFGQSPERFDQLIRSYSNGTFQTLDVALDSATIPQLPAGRDLSALESLDLIANMMWVSGHNANRLDEVVEAMQRAAPGSAVARAWRIRLAARQDSSTALDQLVHGVNVESDPQVLRGAGLAFFERALAVKSDARPDVAFKLLDLATQARPDDAEAVWAYATLAAGLKLDLPVARDRIEAVRALWPGNADLAMAATQVYEALGENDKAREAVRTTRKLAKRPEMIRWAKQKLEQSAVESGEARATQ